MDALKGTYTRLTRETASMETVDGRHQLEVARQQLT